MKTKSAFTLVELLVVITILAILWTIWFISLSSYNVRSRDTVRITSVQEVQKALNLFRIENTTYPEVTNGRSVTHSGAVLWNEGVFWAETVLRVKRLSQYPVDPLTKNPFTYSVTTDFKSYQLGYSLENDSPLALSEVFLQSAYASTNDMRTKIAWNYTWSIIEVASGATTYILAVPSIMSSNKSKREYTDLIQSNDITYDGFANLPSSYGINNLTIDRWFKFANATDVVLFQWNKADLTSSQEDRLLFYKNISDVYNNSLLASQPQFKKYADIHADIYNPTLAYINASCETVKELLDQPCESGDQVMDLRFINTNSSGALYSSGELLGQSGVINTALAPVVAGKTNYMGQWNLAWYYNQWRQNMNKERNTLGMTGGLNRSLGIKWKQFTNGAEPPILHGGLDIDGDGNENILYGYGGKLYLGDPTTGGNIWETKVLDIQRILGVESILWDGSKSIIVALTNDWYIGVINGKTGELEWISENVSGPVKKVRVGAASWTEYKVFDTNNDGINEYHFKQWYAKYNSMRFFAVNGRVYGETLSSSEGYGSYNEGSDDYQPNTFSLGTVNNTLVVGAKWGNNVSFYGNNVNGGLAGIDAFKMPWFAKIVTGTGTSWNTETSYFYDINNDGNDEYFYTLTEEINNYKPSKVGVMGISSTGAYTQYFSLSNPYILNGSGYITSFANFWKVYPLKNANNPQESYVLVNGVDPNNTASTKYMMMKYSGANTTGYKKTSTTYESFNVPNIIYNAFDTTFTISGIFNNGNKDYVVLSKAGEYYFYNFTGTGTFLTPSTLKITGSYSDLFRQNEDIQREKNKNAGIFIGGKDTNGNGLKEFAVNTWNMFKLYEITDSGVVLVKSYWPNNTISSVKKWWFSEDGNMFAITYNTTTNAVNYYKTNIASGDITFTKLTNDNWYGGWALSNILISRLWPEGNRYNRVMLSGLWMFDVRGASPSIAPVKQSSDYFPTIDMDNDGINEVIQNNKAYTFNAPGSLTQKYASYGLIGDQNSDGVLDNAYAYCANIGSTPYLFFTIRSGVDNSVIGSDLNWGNGNGNCSGWIVYDPASVDFNGIGREKLIAGIAARATRIIDVQSGSITEWNQLNPYSDYYGWLAAFDVDGDGIREVIRWDSNAWIMKGSGNTLTTLVNIPGEVGTNHGVSGWMPSFYRNNWITYIAFKWPDGKVALKSWSNGITTTLFNYYFLNTKRYGTFASALAEGVIPVGAADVLLWDFIGNGWVQVLIGGGDGTIYIVSTNGTILKALNIGSSIKRMAIGDANEDNFIDVLISADDGYVYMLGSSRIDPPSLIRDGPTSGVDIWSQADRKKASLNYAASATSSGYFVQLYNRTHKSAVFDWIDVGNSLNVCITSPDTSNPGCIPANKNFNLLTNSVYQWKVQGYNFEITSPIGSTNGFTVQ